MIVLLLLLSLSAADVASSSGSDEVAAQASSTAIDVPGSAAVTADANSPAPSLVTREAEQPAGAQRIVVAENKTAPIADIAPTTTSAEPITHGFQLVRADERYPTQGRQVRVEVLRPDSDERRPAVIILHGASGIGDGAFYHAA